MKELRNKLKDQSGASILLALLFFLLCCMVGASVLMAAASNAGKLRSNRESQQDYLLLSSALRLVCDELTTAEYSGAFTDTEITENVPAEKDDEGNVTAPGYSYTYHIYEQTAGEFKCALGDVLPLLPELDRLFAGTFPPGGAGASEGDDIYKPLSDSQTAALETHELTLNVNTSEVSGLEDMVTVWVKMDETYSIRLTAVLGEADASGYVYTMEAQLTPSGVNPDMKSKMTGPRTWTLEWIAKKEAGDVT